MKATRTRMARHCAYLLFSALAILLPAVPAAADDCPDCGEATKAEVFKGSGVTLAWDEYFRYDAGNCVFTKTDTDEPHLLESKLELRASGEVWNCPASSSSTSISAKIKKEDRTEWAETVGVEGEMKTLAASLKVRYSRSLGGSDSISEETDLTKTLQATYCHRIPWIAYLQVGQFELSETYALTQRYAWWVKNIFVSETVFNSGNYVKECGSKTITLQRRAPLQWTLHLAQNSCGVACAYVAAKDLGYFPPLTENDVEPKVPDNIDWPSEEEQDEPDAPLFPENSGDLPPPPTAPNPEESK